MTLMAYEGYGPELEKRTGDEMSPIRKTKESLYQKQIFDRAWACVFVHAIGSPSVKYTCCLSVHAIIGLGRRY